MHKVKALTVSFSLPDQTSVQTSAPASSSLPGWSEHLSCEAFPTEAAIRAKAAKAVARAPPRKRQQSIEQHFDDCGTDTTGIELGHDDLFVFSDCDQSDTEQVRPSYLAVQLQQSFNAKLPCQLDANIPSRDMVFLAEFGRSYDPQLHVDMIELCGGEGRVAYIVARRHGRSIGPNFDIVAEFDLLRPADVDFFWYYMQSAKPFLAVMSSPCTGLAGWQSLNKVINYEAWSRSRRVSIPLGRLAGRTALFQLQGKRHFFKEQPAGSDLYKLAEWEEVQRITQIPPAIFHQCMLGLVWQGAPILKPTEARASSELLLYRLRDKICPRQHVHGVIGGNRNDGKIHAPSKAMQTWPWRMARAIADGAEELLESEGRSTHAAYLHNNSATTNATTNDTTTYATRPPLSFMDFNTSNVPDQHLNSATFFPTQYTCPGCRGKQAKGDVRHTRDPDTCRFPLEMPMEYSCPGCKSNLARAHPSHTQLPGECKWVSARTAAGGVARRGAHPREARVAASDEPSSSLHPDMGQVDVSESSAPRSKASLEEGAVQQAIERSLEDHPSSDDPPQVAGGSSSSRGPIGRAVRSDTGTQHDAPVRHDEVAVQAAEPTDWSKFDLGRTMKALRSPKPGVISRGLRQLHIRWHHVGSKRMSEILRVAGVPDAVTAMVPSIIDTCRVCRAWQRVGPRLMSTATTVGEFNHTVEQDLLFYRDYIIQHLVDKGIRWSSAIEVKDRLTETLLAALSTQWIAIFGPMKVLTSDGEGAYASARAGLFLQRLGIERVLRAPGQHGVVVERHHEVLRVALQHAEEQLKEEGIDLPFSVVLAQCIFAKNAILTSASASPYQALLGRTPGILPDVDRPTDPESAGFEDSQQISRAREIAVKSIVESTAAARMKRAAKAHTRMPGEALQLQTGDLIEFYRDSGSKDVSGWRGPAVVTDVSSISAGVIHCKWQGRLFSVKVGEVRRALVYLTFLQFNRGQEAQPWRYLVQFVEQLSDGIRVGWISVDGSWKQAKQNPQEPKLIQSILHTARFALHIDRCIGARLGHGVRKLEAVSVDEAVLLHWQLGKFSEHHYVEQAPVGRISFEQLIGPDWPNTCYIQFLCIGARDYDSARAAHPEMPPPPSPSGSSVSMRDPSVQEFDNSLKRRCSETSINERPHKSLALGPEAPLTQEEKDALAQDTAAPDGTASDDDISDISLLVSAPLPLILAGDCPPDVAYFDFPSALTADECHSEGFVELGFAEPTPKLTLSMNKALADNEHMIIRSYHSDCNVSEPVIVKEYNILTLTEARAHAEACKAAMIAEIKRWVEMKAWKRMKRSEASSILDSRWVLKWKLKEQVKLIQARLTARGYKDRQGSDIITHSATTTRWGQKLLLVVIAQRGWKLYSFDVSQAFLRGITFQELSDSGESQVMRHVELDLPPGSVSLLQSLPGYSDFNAATETLSLIKPGYGLKDAPRLWNLALTRCLVEAGLRKLQGDEQLFVKHVGGVLVLIVSTHVDDLKAGGEDAEITALVKLLESRFDALKTQIGEFEHLGLVHKQYADYIAVHQNQYIAQLRTINSADVPQDDVG